MVQRLRAHTAFTENLSSVPSSPWPVTPAAGALTSLASTCTSIQVYIPTQTYTHRSVLIITHYQHHHVVNICVSFILVSLGTLNVWPRTRRTYNSLSFGLPTSSPIMTQRLISDECSALACT